jgi:conjugative relaxase-like TrwC/TraI family protein
MLRITVSTSAEAAKSYYRDSFKKGDYYQEDDITGTWGGRLAETLNLRDDVSPEAFTHLIDNRHPHTLERLTPRLRTGRRVGYDFTFNAPKSVSLMAEIAGDTRLIKCFEEAVAETMKEIETLMMTRIRKNGENNNRLTGNLASD